MVSSSSVIKTGIFPSGLKRSISAFIFQGLSVFNYNGMFFSNCTTRTFLAKGLGVALNNISILLIPVTIILYCVKKTQIQSCIFDRSHVI